MAVTLSTLPLNELLRVDAETYNADTTACRKTYLDLIERSPAHVAAAMAGLHVPTDAQKFGNVIHTFILEPDLVSQRYYVEPAGDGRTKAVRDARTEAAAQNPGRQAVSEDEWREAHAIRDAVYRTKSARQVLGVDGQHEASMLYRASDTGTLCKARYDFIAPRRSVPFAVDVKSTVDASPGAFRKAIYNYRYDVQSDHYLEPVDGVRFVLLAVEKKPPYACATYAITSRIRQLGNARRMPNLRLFAQCQAKNEWPGYPDEIQHIALEPWMYHRHDL